MSTRKPIHFALTGLALGAVAGLAVGLDRASAVEPMGFFGLVGLGLGYALHDFNWRARKRAAAVIGGVFAAPLVAIATMIALGFMPFDLAKLPALIGGGVGAGGLLALLGYGVHSVFHPGNAEGLVRNMPASTLKTTTSDWDELNLSRDDSDLDPTYAGWAGNAWSKW